MLGATSTVNYGERERDYRDETWKLEESVGIRVLSPPLMAPFEPFVGPSNIIFLQRIIFYSIHVIIFNGIVSEC